MPTELPEPIKLHNGRLVLFKMRNSGGNWFARFKTDKGWRAKSTGTNNEYEAARIAYNLFDSRTGPPTSHSTRHKSEHSFEYYADRYQELLRKDPKVIHDTYRSILKNWVIPFFGKIDIDTIRESTIEDYWEWCNAKRCLAKDTVNQHHSILRGILNVAVKAGTYPKDALPTQWGRFNKGYRGKPRPSFMLEDYRKVHRALRYYHRKSPPSKKAEYLRQVMREYVLLVANTGIRPGREMSTLKWKNVDQMWTHPVDKQKYVRIHVVEGKRDDRPVIARHSCRTFLNRLGQLTGRTKPDDYLFCFRDGAPINSFYDSFRRFLIKYNLRYDLSGQERTLYSLRHFYITCQILYNRMPLLVLAKQCGTSVAIIEKHYAKVTTDAFAKELAS